MMMGDVSAMFLEMLGNVEHCWAMLGNVEQCWVMLAASRYHEGSSSPLCSSNSLCNPFARSAGIFLTRKAAFLSIFRALSEK